MNAAKGIVKTQQENKAVKTPSVQSLLNDYLDQNGFRRRFDELLGGRSPQFISSVVTLVNGTPELLECFNRDPIQIVKGALKAATYDLPIEPSLGYAYLIPFRDKKTGTTNATFILGYKGMVQLALRTGLYQRLNTIEVHEGELVSYDRMKEDIEFRWIEDEEERAKAPVIGYAAYYRLNNGMEKTLYMTKKQIEAHEAKNRKGKYQNSIWRDQFNSMARKTLLRLLLSKWGIMSINYLDASPVNQEIMKNLATGHMDDDDTPVTIDAEAQTPQDEEIPFDSIPPTVDKETGEVLSDGRN